MSQSGQLTLELPYVIIGLGATPNFVEKLTVAVPPNKDSVCIFNHIHHSYLYTLEETKSYLYSNDTKFTNCCYPITIIRSL